jgi:hypothetical protein
LRHITGRVFRLQRRRVDTVTVLRKHPKVHWPPQWNGSCGPDAEFPAGEQGVLKKVQYLTVDPTAAARVQLRIEHDGNEFWAFVPSDDPVLLSRLYAKLKDCIGHSMGEVGSLDLDF